VISWLSPPEPDDEVAQAKLRLMEFATEPSDRLAVVRSYPLAAAGVCFLAGLVLGGISWRSTSAMVRLGAALGARRILANVLRNLL
jgi:hypothetical protein